jgi:hypothetical protein
MRPRPPAKRASGGRVNAKPQPRGLPNGIADRQPTMNEANGRAGLA